MDISGSKDRSFYVQNTIELPRICFEIIGKLKYGTTVEYKIVEGRKHSIMIAPDKKELVLYMEKKTGSVLEDIFFTDASGRKLRLSEMKEVVYDVYQIVRVRGLKPGNWNIEVGTNYIRIDILLGLVLLIIGSYFFWNKFYSDFYLSGTLRVKDDASNKLNVAKLRGKKIFIGHDSIGITLDRNCTGSSIAKLSPTRDDGYRISLEVLKKEFSIIPARGVVLSKIKLMENFDYRLKSNEYECVLNYYENNPNPYTPGKPVGEEMFADREDVDKVVDIFRSKEPEIVLLWGSFYSGKTSIVKEVKKRFQESHHCIWININKILSLELKDKFFLGTLLYEICQQLPTSDKKNISNMRNMESLSLLKNRFLIELNKYKEKRPLILIDESSYDLRKNTNVFLIKNLEEIIRFFKELDASSFSLLISYSKIEPVFPHTLGIDKWNWINENCDLIKVGLLDAHSTEKFIMKIEEYCPSLKISNNILHMINNLSGEHPYFIQLLCFTVITYCNERKKRILFFKKDINNCIQIILKNPGVNLNFWLLWRNLSELEKIVLSILVELKEINCLSEEYEIINLLREKKVSEKDISQITQNFDLLQKTLSQRLIINRKEEIIPLFERWIKENISLDLVLKEFQKDA